MRPTLLATALLVATVLSGCMDAGPSPEPTPSPAQEDDPPAPPTPQVSPPAPTPTTLPPGPEVSPCDPAAEECFDLVWIQGHEEMVVPEGQVPPSVPFCGDSRRDSGHFVHEVDLDAGRIWHRAGHEAAPRQALLVFDHFQSWNDCGLAYFLVADVMGSLPVQMGRGDVHAFGWQDGEAVVDRHRVAAGESMRFQYNATEEMGDTTLRYEGGFEVRHQGLWPVAALQAVEE